MDKTGSPGEYIIQTKGLSKSFSMVKVLHDIDFSIKPGKVHCLVGENGAGKSTFIKLLSGALTPDSGTIIIDGKEYEELNPRLSENLGVHVIYQENILVSAMSVAENIFVGKEVANKFGWMNLNKCRNMTRKLIESFDINLDPDAIVERLSTADQQYVKILKAIASNSRILIMDEPTSMFNSSDAQRVLDLVKLISSKGIAIIYISHHLKEIVEIADRVTVLRDGAVVNCYENAGKNIDLSIITKDMVGRSVDLFYKKEKHDIGKVKFEFIGIKLEKNSKSIDFNVREGEILGIAGMIGSGRTELVRAIFGADRPESCKVLKYGQTLKTGNPVESIKNGLAFITEDRQRSGLSLSMNIIDNIIIVNMSKTKGIWFSMKKSWEKVKPVFDKIRIKAASPNMQVKFLSGGNQQKVVIGKWLMVNSDLIIFDEPTRGIDINAKSEIYGQITALAKQGKSIIMISSDMPELIALSDRVMVMRNNEIVGELQKEKISEEAIISKALEVSL